MVEHLLGLLGARLLADALLWGTVGAVVLLVLGVCGSVALARTRALAVTFPGARYARGVTYCWICLACFFGGGALSGLHGAVGAFEAMVHDPAFAATALRPAAAPLADGLIHAVGIQAAIDPAPMLAGLQPVPAAPLRRVLVDTTGAAFLAGLRRVPALGRTEARRSGSSLLAGLGAMLAEGKMDAALDAMGLVVPMAELAAALPADPAAVIARPQLVTMVEQVLLPRFVSAWIVRGGRHLLWSGALWLLLALVAPIALVWAVEGVVRLARARHPS